MTYQEIYDEVVALTKRPELANETRIAIQSVTFNHHVSNSWKRDMVDVNIIFPTLDFIQQIDLDDQVTANLSFPKWRAFSYVRRFDVSTQYPNGIGGAYLTPQDPDKILDDYSLEMDNIYYQSTHYLKFKSRTPIQYLLCGYYTLPTVGTIANPSAAYSSWIATLYPYAIIFDAAARVFAMKGATEQAKAMMELKGEADAMVTINNTELVIR